MEGIIARNLEIYTDMQQ